MSELLNSECDLYLCTVGKQEHMSCPNTVLLFIIRHSPEQLFSYLLSLWEHLPSLSSN